MPLYFAYGTNMDVDAMRQRCPRSPALGPARLARHRIFVMGPGFVSVRREANATVHGVLYDLAFADLPGLDKYEEVGAGLYRKISQPVLRAGGTAVRALLYVGAVGTVGAPRPGHVASLVAAARAWRLPQPYLAELAALDPAVTAAPGVSGPRAIRNLRALDAP